MSEVNKAPLEISLINLELKPIPLEIPFIEIAQEPVRWWSVKTTMSYLGVSERQIRRYLKSGKLEKRYRIVKGHRRVYICNLSAISLKDEINEKHYKEPEQEELEDDELADAYWDDRLIRVLNNLRGG